MSEHVYNRIVDRLKKDWPEISAEAVKEVHETGSVTAGVISDSRDEALTEAIVEELTEYGLL